MTCHIERTLLQSLSFHREILIEDFEAARPVHISVTFRVNAFSPKADDLNELLTKIIDACCTKRMKINTFVNLLVEGVVVILNTSHSTFHVGVTDKVSGMHWQVNNDHVESKPPTAVGGGAGTAAGPNFESKGFGAGGAIGAGGGGSAARSFMSALIETFENAGLPVYIMNETDGIDEEPTDNSEPAEFIEGALVNYKGRKYTVSSIEDNVVTLVDNETKAEMLLPEERFRILAKRVPS